MWYLSFVTASILACLDAKTLYHGTSWSNCKQIRADGFIPSLEDGKQHTHNGEGVYFTPDRQHALRFARRAARWGSEPQCLISVDVREPHRALAIRPASDNFNFDAPVDFTKTRSGREYVFKHQGVEKLAGTGVTFTPVDSRGKPTGPAALGGFYLNKYVFFDLDGHAHRRKLSELISRGERRYLSGRIDSHMSSVALLTDPSFHLFHAVSGAVAAGLGCDGLNLDCGGDVLEGALVGVSEAGGAVVGGAVGAAGGVLAGGYAAGAVMLATGVVCPWCVPAAAALGGIVGQGLGSELGARLAAELARWFSAHTVRKLIGFMQRLAGSDGAHAAVQELELSWYSRRSCSDIRKQRRSLMLRYHPDKCPSEHCKEKSVRLNAAALMLLKKCEDGAASDEL